MRSFNRALPFYILSLIAIPLFSQQAQDTLTLNEQFESMIKRSNRYLDYKVVKVVELNRFHENAQDSLEGFRSQATSDRSTIARQRLTIDSLQLANSGLQESLVQSKAKEEGILLFGSLINKGTYKTILWSLIGLLVVLLVALFLGYRNRAAVSKGLSEKLGEVEQEFEDHRQRALEREQQIRRKLQDEINKNKTDP